MLRALVTALILCTAPAVVAQLDPARAGLPESAPPGIELIQRTALIAHAEFLASDELGGRMTGSPGQERAAEYIAEHFAKLGLEPMGDPGSDGPRGWFQEYPVVRTYLDAPRLQIVDAQFEAGFAVLSARKRGDVDAERWVLVDPRSDPEDLPDLHGAVAVAVLRTPALKTRNINAVFGSAMRSFAKTRGIARKMAKAGAVAVAFCIRDNESGVVAALNMVGLAPGQDQLEYGGGGGGAGGMSSMARMWKTAIPQVFLSASLSIKLLDALGVDDPARVGAAVGAAVAGGLHLAERVDDDARARNVVAVLRGSDPTLAGEAVIYSAHMDHVGRRLDGDVFNGADDNASGTSGLLEIATAFAGAPKPPRRSIVFLSVSGEELGLWGSQWYSEHPTWELDALVANVNVDMIGRSGPESGEHEITVTPSYRHARFSTLVRDAARFGEALGLRFTNGDKYYTRSDHYNFARKGIPVVFFCNGEHEDYHQVSDHPEKLDSAKMERAARLAYWIGHAAAQADGRPERLGRRRGWDGRER